MICLAACACLTPHRSHCTGRRASREESRSCGGRSHMHLQGDLALGGDCVVEDSAAGCIVVPGRARLVTDKYRLLWPRRLVCM
jgi:hypothetical protein